MIEIELIEISGFRSAVEALRLPFGLDCRSITDFEMKCGEKFINTNTKTHFSEKDLLLMHTLVKRGDEHAKAIRGINVYLKINAPRFFYQELDTYVVGRTPMGSNSTMHQQCKGMSEEELVKAKEELKEGTMQTRMQMISYQTLRRMYFQRKDHRLPHWRVFCDFIKTLPFSEQLILVEYGQGKG